MVIDLTTELEMFDQSFNLVYNQISHSAQMLDKVFENDLGCCKQAKDQIYLKANLKPIFRPKRLVPYAAQSIVDKELNRLEVSSVHKPVKYSSLAASTVVVKTRVIQSEYVLTFLLD